jgi:Predicted redox protein, regulator of disulfide bond formation
MIVSSRTHPRRLATNVESCLSRCPKGCLVVSSIFSSYQKQVELYFKIAGCPQEPQGFSHTQCASIRIDGANRQYTAHAVAKGAGRNGEVESNGLALHLASPKELGGKGEGQNPEQLFAMGYSGKSELRCLDLELIANCVNTGLCAIVQP